MRAKLPSVVLMLVLAALSGCASQSRGPLGQKIDDTNITAAINSKLRTAKGSPFTAVDVDTVGGVVSLNGVVPSAQERARAEQLAAQVGGVKRVINYLQVQGR
ncbi:MAG TPA: BON domain-containing protein [Candidatus Binatia bacterium]